MKNYRNIIFYVVVVSLFLYMMYWVVQFGKPLEAGKTGIVNTVSNESLLQQFKNAFTESLTHPLATLLLQIITIIFTARTFGFLFNKMGQPTVIGEVVAGIFLGPSLLGMWFPQYTTFLFPKSSLPNLQFFSQIGLLLFMFVVGMELDLKVLRTKAREAIVISHASIVIPFTLGMGLSYFLYKDFAPSNINFLSFSLFMGISMSITAFPVLARIIQERGMTKSKLGIMAITCAAIDDISAWCILAVVIAVVKAGSVLSALFTIVMAIGFVFIMLKLVRPFLKKLGEVYSNKETLSLNIVAIIFGILLISAYVTEVIGIHALFGAFMAGVIMPPSYNFRRILIEKVEYVALGLLLPLFFAFSGLRTQIGLLNDGELWGTAFVIIFIAILGKFGGSMLTSRFMGNSWRESLSIGALMNTRGLVELVVLNIGYDLGVLSPQIFAMLVLMALFTTFMTGPVLDLIKRFSKEAHDEKSDFEKQKFKVLVSFGNPQTGKKIVRLANMLSGSGKQFNSEITALHVSPSADINKFNAAEYEKESFKPVKAEAHRLGIELKTKYKISNDVSEEILSVSHRGEYNLLLVGAGQSIFQGSLLGKVIGITAKALNPEKLIGSLVGKESLVKSSALIDEKTKAFISESEIPVGVLIDKDFNEANELVIPVFSVGDVFLFFYIKRVAKTMPCKIKLVDYNGIISSNVEILEEISGIRKTMEGSIDLIAKRDFDLAGLGDESLLMLSFEGWKVLEREFNLDETIKTSVLLMRP
ncbi:MAG TPA: cation:proton antiporter [Bacteroidia bacterium]|jgi:Kef-type K+ transport system membrane component KefB|nr:cation:proton antiporter [Bacteroidia bacterium]